ncbi:phosphatase PAP2 family protein [Adhaeribacter rhizoryzae]|uniref:Phosphatase PAP2 family protein n=1 Tax=Adhaeribacter rhizoryzae TaxID=2607907 RepID=A0A5M6DPX9_9BACT|nr:phosphatase PAP2 family protein [Adhaeribacter rhizoryzae]KAA5548240.1 phosphatase PAP2 family protein [Adhaeribacter rhizoryzae]
MKRIFKKALAFFALFTVELLFIWTVFISCLLLFLFLAREILQGQEINFDMRAFAFADSLYNPAFDGFMKNITFFASRDFITGASLMLIFYFLFIRRHKWYSIKVPVIALGSISLNLILKFLFDRERPIIPHLVKSYGLSFPSGHAMISASFYGLLIYLVWVNVKNPLGRWALVVALALFILLIGFSRVYLHVHYASDVLAGFAAGLLWVIIAVYVLRRIERYSRRNIAPIVEEST